MWQVTGDTWHVICDTWHVTHDTLFIYLFIYFIQNWLTAAHSEKVHMVAEYYFWASNFFFFFRLFINKLAMKHWSSRFYHQKYLPNLECKLLICSFQLVSYSIVNEVDCIHLSNKHWLKYWVCNKFEISFYIFYHVGLCLSYKLCCFNWNIFILRW